MLFTKFKKGVTWLRRDFEIQLRETLDANLVVDLCRLPEFAGRARVVENMISRGELEEANYLDIQKQTQVETIREKRAKAEQTRQKQMDKEEIALREAVNCPDIQKQRRTKAIHEKHIKTEQVWQKQTEIIRKENIEAEQVRQQQMKVAQEKRTKTEQVRQKQVEVVRKERNKAEQVRQKEMDKEEIALREAIKL